MVIAIVRDLIFRSKIREALSAHGFAPAKFINSFEDESLGRAKLLLVDLHHDSAISGIQGLRSAGNEKLQIVGFYSHVNEELADLGREAGVNEVIRRSLFFRRLPVLLGAIDGTVQGS